MLGGSSLVVKRLPWVMGRHGAAVGKATSCHWHGLSSFSGNGTKGRHNMGGYRKQRGEGCISIPYEVIKRGQKLARNLGFDLPEDIVGMAVVYETPTGDRYKMNHRMETLGDAVLAHCLVGSFIRKYPNMDNTCMFELLKAYGSNKHLAGVSARLELSQFIPSCEPIKLYQGKCADLVESFIGSVHTIYGHKGSMDFVQRHILNHPLNHRELLSWKNPQQYLTSLIHRSGKPHISFAVHSSGKGSVGVIATQNGIVIGSGKGKSKKEAQASAALDALYNHVLAECKTNKKEV